MQRARFFGYKSKLIGLCRVWLDQDSIVNFTKSVKDEKRQRDILQVYAKANKWLDASSMEVIIDRCLSPSRRSVIYSDLERTGGPVRWVSTNHPQKSPKSNIEPINEFYKSHFLDFEDKGLKTTYEKSSHTACLLQSTIVLGLLKTLGYNNDKDKNGLEYLRAYLAGVNVSEKVYVVSMGSRKRNDTLIQIARERSLNSDGAISSLLQGENQFKGHPNFYKGDREVRQDELVTLQIHKLKVEGLDCIALAYHIDKEGHDGIKHITGW